MYISDMITVLQAAKDGKTIEREFKHRPNSWTPHNCHAYNFADFNYRVKPEPMVVYVNIYKGGYTCHKTEAKAIETAARPALQTAVKFIQAMDGK